MGRREPQNSGPRLVMMYKAIMRRRKQRNSDHFAEGEDRYGLLVCRDLRPVPGVNHKLHVWQLLYHL